MRQLFRDGVALAFEDVGKGAPPILLVHGLASDHTTFISQIAHFRRHHRVVAVDLRGHGQSAKAEQDCTVAGFADDLAWLCYELGVYMPVVLGHGLGGAIALELAARYPDLPAAAIALDAPALAPPATRAGWNGALAVASCPVPVLYVGGGSEAADLDRSRERRHRLIVSRLGGVDHFLPHAPDQLNALIDRFLGLLPGGTPSAQLPSESGQPATAHSGEEDAGYNDYADLRKA